MDLPFPLLVFDNTKIDDHLFFIAHDLDELALIVKDELDMDLKEAIDDEDIALLPIGNRYGSGKMTLADCIVTKLQVTRRYVIKYK